MSGKREYARNRMGLRRRLGLRAYHGQRVTRRNLGDRWPFGVDEGELGCYVLPRGAREAVFKAWGVTYALNGPARAAAAERGYVDIHDTAIWREDPAAAGLKISLASAIRFALSQARHC